MIKRLWRHIMSYLIGSLNSYQFLQWSLILLIGRGCEWTWNYIYICTIGLYETFFSKYLSQSNRCKYLTCDAFVCECKYLTCDDIWYDYYESPGRSTLPEWSSQNPCDTTNDMVLIQKKKRQQKLRQFQDQIPMMRRQNEVVLPKSSL